METPLDAQREVYGTKGPPMLYETPEEEVARVRQQRRRKRRKVSHANTKMSAEEVLRLMKQHKRSIDESNASTGALPGDFPPELSYRALAAYSLLRTLSVQLRLSPFTPTVFLRALYLPFPNKLMGQIHVSLLRILLPNLKMGYSYKASGGGIAVHKRRHVDNIRWTLRAGENLTFLDSLSWPLFFDDYCHLTADRLWASIHDNELNLDFRNVGIQPIGVKEYEDDDDQSEDEHYRQPILPMAALPLMTSMPIAVPGYAAPMMPPGPTGPKELYSDDSEYGADSEEEGTWGSRKEKRRRKKRKQRLNPANSPLAGPKIPSTTTTPTNPLPAKTTIPTKRPTLPMSRNKKLPTKKSPMQLNSGAKSPKKSPHKRPISKCVVSDPLRSASKVVGVDSTPTKESSQYFAGSKVMDVESPIVGMLETTTPTSLPVAPTLLRKPEQRGTPLVPTRGDRKVSKVFEVTEATPLHKSYLVKRTPEKQQSPMKLDFGSATKEDLFTKTCSGDSNIKADDKRTEEFSQKQPRNNTKKLPENLSFESTDNSFKKDSTTSAEESSQKDSPKTKEKVTPQKVPIRREAKSCQKGINGRRMLPIISKKPSPEKKNEAMDIQTRQLNVDSTRQGSSEPSRNSEHDSTKRNSPSSKRPRGRLVLPMHNASKNMHPNPPADIPVSHALKKQAVGITQQQRQLQMQQFHKYQMQQMQMQQFRMQQTAQAKGFMPGNINPQLMMQNKYSFQGVPQYGHAPHFVPSSMSRGEGHTRMLHHQQMIGLMPHTGGHPLKPGMTDHYAFQPSRNKPLEVSGAIASALQNFMCGIESKPTDSTDDTLGKSTGFEDDDDFDAVLDNERWRHFEPLKVIRAGVPYHKLPITQKMDILEFLIDELLSVDVIAAEFSKRKTISDCYEFPWGVLPAEAEFESLENDDECGVCLGEGELLCCDGCVSSYHRGCLDMSLGQVLPDGKWLCPECHLVDPAKYGPLRGGRKASLDWFSVDDISAAIRNNEPQILLGSQGNSNSMIAPASTDISENSAGALKVLSGELSTARKEISGGVVQASTVQLASNQTSAGEAISRCFKSSFEVPILDKGAQVSQINVIEPKSGDLKTVGVDPPALDKGASVDATKQLSVEVPDLNNRIDLQLSSAMGNSAEANKPPDITLQLKVEPVDPAKNATALKELPLNPEVENGEEPPREMSMPKGQETQKSDETIGSANSITPGLESALALQQAGDIEPDPLCKGLEFLVVHGHMFCRRIIDSFEGKNVEFERQQPYFVLTREEVEKYFKQVGGKISRSWPFAQIPASDASSSSWQFPSSRLYMSPMEAFDPSFYANRYRKAPVSFFMKAGGGAHIMKLMLSDYENECSQSSTYRVTEALTRDMSLDKYVADCLRTQLSLFDQYQMVTGYMVRLDAALKKSCLINELWETGSTRTRDEVWLCNVRKCKSVGRLSLLLLKLVDQIHPRAFKDDWFHNPLARGSSDVIFDSHYEDLPTNWSEKTEMRKRLWERTPSEMLLDLCKKEECHIEDFLQGVRSDVGKPIRAMRSKRKPGKPSVDKEKESFLVHGQQFENIPIPIQHDLDKVSQKPSSGHDNTGNAGKPSTVPGESNSFSDHVHLDVDKITGIEPSDEGNKSEFHCKAPEVPEDREDTIDTGKAESTDPSEGPEIVNAGNKRRTRRSGRFGRFAVEAGPLAKKVRLSASESSRGPNTLSDLELQIVKHKKSKVPELEKIAKGVCPREMLWPIAGRNPFATFGNLPPREMKRLARNAGSVRAPHLAYGTSHEVAQVCLAYTWRKRTEMCSSIEELILQIRVLESCLDRAVMHSCENLVRRKSQINKLVRCSQRDPRSGIVDHFVVNKGRTKGCWISSEHIDLSALVLELHTRRQKHTDKRMQRIRAEKQGEKERKAEQAAEAQRRAVEQLREKMRLEAIRQKQKAEQESAARLANQKTQASNPMHGSMQLEMTKHNQDFKLTLMQHENDIRQLMQACILSRVLPVPEGQIVAIRNRNLARLKAAVEGLRRCNVPLSIDHEQLTNVLVAREKGAAESILNLKKGLRANNMPTASSQNTSSTSAPLGGFSSQPFTQSLSTHSYQSQGQNTGPQNSSAVLGSFNSFSSTPTHHVTSFSHGRNDGSGGYRVNDMRKQRKNKPTPSLPPQKMSSSKGQQLDFDELSDMDDIFGSSEIPSPSPTTAANGLNNQAMSTISLQNQGNQNTLPGMQDWQQPAGQTANFGLGPTPIRNDNFGPQVMSLPQGHATMSIQGPHGNQPLPSQGNTMQQQLYMIQGQQHQFMMQQPQLHQPPQQLPQHFMPQQLDPAPQQHFMMQQQQPYQSQQVTQPQLYNPQQQQLQRLQQQQYQQQQHHQSFF